MGSAEVGAQLARSLQGCQGPHKAGSGHPVCPSGSGQSHSTTETKFSGHNQSCLEASLYHHPDLIQLSLSQEALSPWEWNLHLWVIRQHQHPGSANFRASYSQLEANSYGQWEPQGDVWVPKLPAGTGDPRITLVWTTGGLPRCLSGKESACQCRRHGFNSWVRKIPWRRKWQPAPVVLPGESHGQWSLAGHSPRGHKESDITEHIHQLQGATYTQINSNCCSAGLSGGSDGKESARNAWDLDSIPGSRRSPAEGNATHSSILAWKLPWTEEFCGLQSMGSQRVRTTEWLTHTLWHCKIPRWLNPQVQNSG